MSILQQLSEKINYDFDYWYFKQADEVALVAEYLLQTMRQKLQEKAEIKRGFLTHIYQKQDFSGFFFDGSPLRTEVMDYLIATESLKYVGRIKHQALKTKAWTVQDDENKQALRLQTKEDLKRILQDEVHRKKIIKSAIDIKLGFHRDCSVEGLMRNLKFQFLSVGFDDFMIKDGKKSYTVAENINQLFIAAIREMEEEKMLTINRFGRIYASSQHKAYPFNEMMEKVGYSFAIE